ncbi:S-protein homolog 21-like [Brassica napus]|nr:S-protein homolog 21-like [Brassica napus]KAF3511728.1 hypothetical protein F2Q69_00000158 [Brassica cretica]CAF1696305.1 unnamed protein product [Brassica napus]VDC85174.1 unnamed protein product [Brassica oleracea]
MRENLVFFLIVFISIHRIDSILLFRHFNIDIQNKLAANQTLMVYCRDKNTLSEVGFLRFKTVLEVKFIIYPKTLIWCNLWKGPDYVHHIRFTAFIGTEDFIHDLCGGMKPNVCFWQVQDDGVWLRHNPSGTLTLMHEWGDKV